MTAFIEVRDLVVEYATPHHRVRAVEGVSLDIARGETLAVVGESGSGKTTLGRALLRLVAPTAGTICFDGIDLHTLGREPLRAMRRRMQVVLQDPQASLDPRLKVGASVREGMDAHAIVPRRDRDVRVAQLLMEVGLTPDIAARYPHEFSGGQRQRIAIARALAVEPEFLVLDEAVSALDVLARANVLELLSSLQRTRGLTYLFIAHDLAVVRHLATRVAVMQLGRIVELAPTATLFATPQHPVTRALLSAVPVLAPA